MSLSRREFFQVIEAFAEVKAATKLGLKSPEVETSTLTPWPESQLELVGAKLLGADIRTFEKMGTLILRESRLIQLPELIDFSNIIPLLIVTRESNPGEPDALRATRDSTTRALLLVPKSEFNKPLAGKHPQVLNFGGIQIGEEESYNPFKPELTGHIWYMGSWQTRGVNINNAKKPEINEFGINPSSLSLNFPLVEGHPCAVLTEKGWQLNYGPALIFNSESGKNTPLIHLPPEIIKNGPKNSKLWVAKFGLIEILSTGRSFTQLSSLDDSGSWVNNGFSANHLIRTVPLDGATMMQQEATVAYHPEDRQIITELANWTTPPGPESPVPPALPNTRASARQYTHDAARVMAEIIYCGTPSGNKVSWQGLPEIEIMSPAHLVTLTFPQANFATLSLYPAEVRITTWLVRAGQGPLI